MTGSSAAPSPTEAATPALVAAAQAALAAEHAAVYGYGVVGARIDSGRVALARTDYAAHLAARDAMRRMVKGLGAEPVAADAAYALPFPVTGTSAAARLAAALEDRVADAYADLVRAGSGAPRGEAAASLTAAAVRAVRWRGACVAFPGMAERADAGQPAASGDPSPDSL